jgi:arylsulfatase A-like enzyme
MTSNLAATPTLGRTHHESTRTYEPKTTARQGSPNVIFVVLDDVGFSDLGCYGSNLETKNFDSLANKGLRYTNFHTTTLCSPTRACLLTGRNAHSVGMRYLSHVDMGWPSGRGEVTPHAATIAQVLKENGYSTMAVGKWHLAPIEETTMAGPFENWPLGKGFEKYYGYLNGGTGQFNPELAQDNRLIPQPKSAEDGYHLSSDLVDQGIRMLSDHVSLTPDKPFFMHFCFAAGHFPHQAPKPYLEKYRGKFDHGWDVEREQRLARQKTLGLVPADTRLPPASPGVMPWTDLSADEKTVALRLQEAYAAFMDYSDTQFGRLLDFLDRVDVRDNTMIVLISDNGACVDCDPQGTTNMLRWFNQLPDSLEVNLANLDEIGGPNSHSNYPWGWAQASNTPLKLFKQFTHGGGVRDPMIVSWPRGIKDGQGVRRQFHHVTDIMPTVLEVCGVSAPDTYRGIPQMPIHGVSFAYSFDAPAAPTRKPSQYFEMNGHRAIWHGGWKAVTRHDKGISFEADRWELYHLDEDFNENDDLAEARPDKLSELKERWWAEAGKYGVMPLDDSEMLFKPRPKTGSIRGRKDYTYFPPIFPVTSEAAPITHDVSHRIEAELELTPSSKGGVIASFGNIQGGYALFIEGEKLVYAYSYVGELTYIEGAMPLKAGTTRVAYVFDKTGPLKGTGSLLVDGSVVAELAFDKILAKSFGRLTIGEGSVPPVTNRLKGKAPLDGKVHRLDIHIGDDREGPLPPNID